MGSKKTALGLMWLIIVILAIPLGIYLIRQSQTPKVQAAASFNVGVNVTGITHYGKNDLLPYSSDSNITADLNEIQRMRGRVVRVFVANNRINDTEAANRLDAFLTRAATYNISVIASLIDFYNSGFGPQGVAYNRCDFNPCLLGGDFFGGGFRGRYKTFVQTVVNRNKNHPNIYAWEIGNELKYGDDGDAAKQTVFVNFMNEMSTYIKSLDPNHSISTGMMYAAHMGMSPDQLYPRLTNFDIISVHAYDGDHTGAADATWARANGKKILIGEIGFNRGLGNDKSGDMRNELNYWKSQGAEVALQWGFLARGLGDNGNGDRSSGMDTIWHSDYDNLALVFQSFNPTSTPTPTPSATPTPTPTPSTCTVSWTLSNNNPVPNTNITVTVYGLSDLGNWQNIGLWRDNTNACPGPPCSLSIQQNPLRFIYSNVNSGSSGNHTLKFTTNNGIKTCTPTKDFTANYTQITQCPLQSPNPRVKDGLITTPILYNNFSNPTGTCVVDDERASFISYKIPTYETLKSDYFDKAKPPIKQPILDGNRVQSTVDNPINLTAASRDRVYHITGNLTINNNGDITARSTGVIFIDGNLNIDRSLTNNNNSAGLVFVVKGNVLIDKSVTQVNAVIISPGTIYTATDIPMGFNTCTTSSVTASRLTINGSLINLEASKPIRFCRKLAGIGNNTAAAEVINQQPKYLVILKDIVADTLQTWSELP